MTIEYRAPHATCVKRAQHAQKGVRTIIQYKQVEIQLEEMDDKEVGAKLRYMRKRKGWSQDKMGEEMFLSRSNISRMEAGLIPISQSRFMQWANKTDSQDIFLAIIFNIDPSVAVEIISNIANTGATVGTFLLSLGGLI
ncbi:helix-turn-helix domain-containing protein [Oceanobacillus kimchii]|uniref:helix-turn-helix domain-containing protein n=1 Tax=Oceanobacillus kimchii TaxID=746691 RepID=UPI003B016A1B